MENAPRGSPGGDLALPRATRGKFQRNGGGVAIDGEANCHAAGSVHARQSGEIAMHSTAVRAGKEFLAHYRSERSSCVLDIGSKDVNGSLRPHADGLRYVGMDIEAGSGVDVVCPPGETFPFEDDSFDLMVTTSCFEHDQFFWMTFLEGVRVLKPGGFFYLNAPSNGPYHGFPFDSWRFYPDAGRALVAWAKRQNYTVRLVESGTLRQGSETETWNDFVAVFQKAPFSEPSAYVLDTFPDAMNVRRSEEGQIEHPETSTEEAQHILRLSIQLKMMHEAHPPGGTPAQAEQASELRDKVKVLEEELARSQRRLDEAHAMLDEIHKSVSWRVTAPIRRLRKMPRSRAP